MDLNWAMIQSIGIIIIGIGYGFSQFKRGGRQDASEVIALLQVKDTEQKEIIKDYQGKFETINKELGVLQGQLQEKDKKLEEYLSILQGRSPEQAQYQTDMREFTLGVAKYMESSSIVLNQMKIFMENLNNKSNKADQWHQKIDKATKDETGKPLRQDV